MQLQMYVLMKNQLTIASAAATVGDIEKNGDLLRQKIEKEEVKWVAFEDGCCVLKPTLQTFSKAQL